MSLVRQLSEYRELSEYNTSSHDTRNKIPAIMTGAKINTTDV